MVIFVKVKTKQKEQSIEEMDDGTYNISVRALPDKNKANTEVISILSKYFEIPKSQIYIQSGKTSTRKKVILEEKL